MVFYILCGVGLDVAFSKCKSRSFVGLAKSDGTGREGIYFSKLLSPIAVSHFFLFLFSFLYSIILRE